jgi:hypothetical protein
LCEPLVLSKPRRLNAGSLSLLFGIDLSAPDSLFAMPLKCPLGLCGLHSPLVCFKLRPFFLESQLVENRLTAVI